MNKKKSIGFGTDFAKCLFKFYFPVCSLTEREIIEREHKKKLLNLAKEHEKARELENVQRYRMPQDIKDDQMQYEMEVDKAPITEQQKWEEEQMSSAVYKFGAKRQEKEQYELLIDNQIEFIQTANIPGTHDDVSCLIHLFLNT